MAGWHSRYGSLFRGIICIPGEPWSSYGLKLSAASCYLLFLLFQTPPSDFLASLASHALKWHTIVPMRPDCISGVT